MANFLYSLRLSRTFFFMLIVGIVLNACRPGSEESVECSFNSDCPSSTPFCLENACVICLDHSDCGCHELCDSTNSCSALSATNASESPNAHGNWIGAPGTESYEFIDYCTEDSDCGLGELCNSATGGCVLAADYPESCVSDADCPRGPVGETLSCDTSRSLCLPAAKCIDVQQCCGRSGIICAQTQGLCLPVQDECTPTPPEELTSTCPLLPQTTEDCADGLFCSGEGRCVQCQCDDDCGSPALKCRLYDGTCVPISYCDETSDCDDGKICRQDVNECVDSCNPEDPGSCPAQSFCDPELLYCRNNSERPCVEDDIAPSHTIEDAYTIPLGDNDEFLAEFALCDGQPDFFALPFDGAQDVQIFVSADERLEIAYALYAEDNETIIATGFVGELGAELLSTTIPRASTRILKVEALNSTEGFYTLNIALAPAETCVPLGETSPNDSPATAFPLWSSLLPSPCETSENNGLTTYSCAPSSFNLCAGDVDYYLWDLPNNATGTFTLGTSSESLLIAVRGPYPPDSTDFGDGPMISPITAEAGLTTYSFPTREAARYLVSVSDPTSTEAPYSIGGELASAGVCLEDQFDATEAAQSGPDILIIDAPGLNDSEPTTLGINPGDSLLPLSVCVNDSDQFNIVSRTTPELFPRGQRVSLAWEGLESPSAYLNQEGVEFPFSFVTDESAPIILELRNDQPTETYDGSLSIRWDEPAPCSTAVNATPIGAILLDTSFAALGSVTSNDAWCGFEDRWYILTLPAGTNLRVETTSERSVHTIEFHDESIRAIETATYDSALGESLLGSATDSLALPNLAFLPSAESDRIIHIRVSNQSLLTDSNLELSWGLFSDTCLPDTWEEDDRAADARLLEWQEGGVAPTEILSACPGDEDWMRLELGESSILNAKVLTPAASNFTFEVYDDALNRIDWSSANTEQAEQTFSLNGLELPSTVYTRLRSLRGVNAYRIDVQADGVCIDDSYEGIGVVDLVTEGPQLAARLCNDQDQYIMSDLETQAWFVCAEFDHDVIDIDIILEDQTGALSLISATKNDIEVISFTSQEGGVYTLTVYADPRSNGVGDYEVTLQSEACTSQP